VDQGYAIVVNIGDQMSDLDGGFAERTFKLPNPFYSSHEARRSAYRIRRLRLISLAWLSRPRR